MENADNINAVARNAIEQKVRPGTVFVITGPHFGARPPARRFCRYGLDGLPELTGIYLRLLDAPAVFCVVPDFVKVRLCERRKDVVAHHKAGDREARFRAMN